jgi:hypothetical protein
MKKNSIPASELDEKFDKGENIDEYLIVKSSFRPGLKQKRVSVDFPEWMVTELDRVSTKLGVTRQSIIKIFISDKLREERNR